MKTTTIWRGEPYPLGATVEEGGVNFAFFSENATAVDLCLFDDAAPGEEGTRVRLAEHTDQVWHGFIPGMKAGQLYGYRVYGPYDPESGHRFNGSKLLLDPYAKAITGQFHWGSEMFGYEMGGPVQAVDLSRDYRDNAWCMPKCVVVADQFDWGDDAPPRTPMAASIIYETHVKGFSRQCPFVPESMRGSYAALGSPFAIEYFKKLGITAVELLPIHQFVNDEFLVRKGLSNYWGYNSIGYFAPHSAYSSAGALGQQVAEFKSMVKSLHAAGIEVILDVVYNHTGEGNHLGPTLCFRGADNSAYYRLVGGSRRFYMDYTGTGNTLNMMHPRVLQLIMDSLRYWVTEMRVDGFRFDLAATLARELHEVSRLSAFFDIIHQDPVLSRVKLIADPWDVGEGGYQVGNFPVLWAEWNGKYRDCVRSHWKSDPGTTAEFACRLMGSSDLYQWDGKRPYASVNLVTSHDGFTLWDLVSYNRKHNDANGEKNQDGHNDNRSWNCGVEGPTEDASVLRLRRRQVRNFLATLLISQGVPMICGGDEFARTQGGNNNAYCHDNELSWLSWEWNAHQKQLWEFTSRLIRFRHEHPVFRRPKFFQGRKIRGRNIKDVMWLNPRGAELTDHEWTSERLRSIAVILCGDAGDVRDSHGQSVRDDTFLLLLNASHEPVPFLLAGQKAVRWELLLDTDLERGFLDDPLPCFAGHEMVLVPRSLRILRLVRGPLEAPRPPAQERASENPASHGAASGSGRDDAGSESESLPI